MPLCRLIVPEVVQTSGMDCGPACLKALLEGFGTPVSYGRLREACQTDVDGTSIDTLEQVACQLGLEAEQVMVPVDHVLVAEANALPAIVVVRLPNGFTHFVVAWRHAAGRVQVMDPATGRRWPTARQFLDEVYVHAQTVPAAGWREWAGSDEFLGALRGRLRRLGMDRGSVGSLVDAALGDPSWRSLAGLDAAARMAEALAAGGGLRRGGDAAKLVARAVATAHGGEPSKSSVPESYWSVRPPADDEESLVLRGAVLARVKGRTADAAEAAAAPSLSPELAAALREKPVRPLAELGRLLRDDGLLAPVALVATLALAATGVMTEALLFRGLLDLGGQLATAEQRLGLMAALLVFVAANRLLAYFNHAGALGLGRRLETRLRAVFLAKLPRLSERYFRSRPVSDMAERAHAQHKLRELADLGRSFCQYLFEVLLTAAGMVWIYPAGSPLILVAVAFSLLVPVATAPSLRELDLRVRTHVGALTRYYLDAFLGLVAVRTHSAERTLRREHETLLGEWVRSKIRYTRLHITVEGVQIAVVLGCVVGVVLGYVARGAEIGGLLLLAYWGVNLPFRGRMVIYQVMDYAAKRNVLLRLLEPLGAPEDVDDDVGERAPASAPEPSPPAPLPGGEGGFGAHVVMDGVSVVAAGHTILRDVDFEVRPGEHVAVVGLSGAGKTTLVGLLLGWHRPAAGRLLVDGERLDAGRLERLRRATAWVDPAVAIWNRSLLDNLRYGNPEVELPWTEIVDRAELRRVLEQLPEGFQTSLGEGGGLVSGGEGQRVRLGRALARPDARLAVLDEPFRGLGRDQRRELLGRARRHWSRATLLCITHDVAETRAFPRVVVIDGGRLVEDGAPGDLAARPDSRYAALLAAEIEVRELWRAGTWRRLWLADGRLGPRTGEEHA